MSVYAVFFGKYYEGYSFTTSVSILLLPGLGDDMFTALCGMPVSSQSDCRTLGLYLNFILLYIYINKKKKKTPVECS